MFAIFPIDVVFPTPFTPTTKITDGFVSNFNELSSSSNIDCISSLNACFTSSFSFIFSFFILFLKLFTILTDGENKSFSYVDVVTKEIEIEYL